MSEFTSNIKGVMSKPGNIAFTAVLLALAVSCGLAGPLSNGETEILDLQEYRESSEDLLTEHKTDGPLLREKRQFNSRLNDYQIGLLLSLRRLKASNCTEEFLNQSVSPHLCNSKWVQYTPLTGKHKLYKLLETVC